MMRTAESYSFDGVLFTNSKPFPLDEMIAKFKVNPIEYQAPPIVPLNREVDESLLMSPKQLAELAGRVICGVDQEMWQYLWSRKAHVFGNCGRPNKRWWINETENTLRNGFVRPIFKDVFYRPNGVEGIVSKGEALMRLCEEYDEVIHYDADAWVTYGLARALPRVKFVLVQGLSLGTLFDFALAKKVPNVSLIGRLHFEEPKDEVFHLKKIPRDPASTSYFSAHYGGYS